MSTPVVPPPRSFPFWPYAILLMAIIALAFAPIAITLWAVGWASANNCQITAAIPPPPCIIDGVDHAADLQWQGNMFWAVIYSFPLAFLLLILWGVVLLIHRLLWGRKKRAA